MNAPEDEFRQGILDALINPRNVWGVQFERRKAERTIKPRYRVFTTPEERFQRTKLEHELAIDRLTKIYDPTVNPLVPRPGSKKEGYAESVDNDCDPTLIKHVLMLIGRCN